MRRIRQPASGTSGRENRINVALASLALVIAAAYGKGASLIPSPHDPGAFWVGNTAAPWLVIAFVAGAMQNSGLAGILVGAVADLAVVSAFYSQFLLLGDGSIVTRLWSWIDFVGPWFALALLGGAAYGYIGHVWRSRRARVGAVLLGLPFVAESIVQRLADGQWPGSIGFFVALGILGLLLSAVAWKMVSSPPRTLGMSSPNP